MFIIIIAGDRRLVLLRGKQARKNKIKQND
jgi:hypothetical protein